MNPMTYNDYTHEKKQGTPKQKANKPAKFLKFLVMQFSVVARRKKTSFLSQATSSSKKCSAALFRLPICVVLPLVFCHAPSATLKIRHAYWNSSPPTHYASNRQKSCQKRKNKDFSTIVLYT